MKTITGFLAILLGGVGVLVTAALIGAVWWGSFQISAQAQKATTQADQSLVQVEEAFGGLKKQLATTTEAVEAVRTSAAKTAQKPNTPSTRAELEGARFNILALTSQGDALREALPPIAQMVESAANVAEQGGNKMRADRLRSIAGNVREAAKELDVVRERSVILRSGESPTTVRDVDALAQQTRKPLDRLTTALTDATQESATLRKELPEAQKAVDKWKLIGAAVATAVLLWVGLGQLAIVSWGRRRLAARTVTAPQPITGAK